MGRRRPSNCERGDGSGDGRDGTGEAVPVASAAIIALKLENFLLSFLLFLLEKSENKYKEKPQLICQAKKSTIEFLYIKTDENKWD